LRRPRSAPELLAALRSALEETTRLSRLARDLLAVADTSSRAEAPTIELRPHLTALAARYRHALGDKVSVECPPAQ
ncbi:sensor histidine kinase, partial [Mycobacterium kansasii]